MYATKAAYWQEMKSKAAANIGRVAEMDEPETEHELKECVAHVMRHGDCHEKADVIIEAFEFMCACHMLKAHELPN